MALRRFLTAGLAVAMALSVSAPAFAHEAHEKAAAARAQAAAAAKAAPGPNASVAPAAAAMQGMPGMAGTMDHEDMMMADGAMAEEAARPMPQRLFNFLGRMHPAAVHFPIALFIVAGFLEIAAVTLRRPVLTQGTRVLVALAAVSALVAVAFGWLNMGLPSPTEDVTHTWHRWLGTSIAALGLVTWWAKEHWVRRPGRPRELIFAAALTTTVGVILANAALGGALTHGMRHLMF